MSNAYQCQKCKQFIIGEHCFKCNLNVRDINLDNGFDEINNIFGGIFTNNKEE